MDDGITDAGDKVIAVTCADGEVFSICRRPTTAAAAAAGGGVVMEDVEAEPTGLDTTPSGVAYC